MLAISVCIEAPMDETLEGPNPALRWHDDLTRTMVESAPIALLATDIAGRIAYANELAVDLFGLAARRFYGESVKSLIADRYQSQLKSTMETAIANPKLLSVGRGTVLHGRRGDGSVFVMEVSLRCAMIEEMPCIIIAILDVTERDLRFDDIGGEQRIYQTLFEAIHDGVGVIQDHHFVLANATLVAMVGCSREDITAAPFTTYLAPEYAQVVKVRYENRMTQEKEPPAVTQCRLQRRDGGLGPWVEINARKITLHGQPASLVVLRDISDRKAAAAALEKLAVTDVLTGLANRHRFMERLDLALLAAQRHRKMVGLLFLDLDGFKSLNDHHGHVAGDAALQQVASRVLGCIRATDVAARFGGDEFVVLLVDLDSAQNASIVAAKILHEMTFPITLEAGSTRLGISIGIATYPTDGADGAALLHCADLALYKVKQAGKGDYRHYCLNT